MAQLSAPSLIIAKIVQMIDATGEIDTDIVFEMLREHDYVDDRNCVSTDRGRDMLELQAAIDEA